MDRSAHFLQVFRRLRPLRPLVRHWRGDTGIVLGVAGLCLGGRVLIDAVIGWRAPAGPLPGLLIVSAISLGVLIWQVGGGLRAVARAGRDAPSAVLGVLGLIATVVLFLGSEASLWAARAEPAVLPSRPVPPPYPVTGDIARIEEEITWSSLRRLEASFAAHPGLRRIEIASPGGLIPVARAMAVRLIAHRTDTRAVGLCASACTLVFMAGAHRDLGPGGSLGFHSYKLLYPNPLIPTGPEEARDRAWLEGRGVDPAFLARAYETPHGALWRPDVDEMRRAGVLTRP